MKRIFGLCLALGVASTVAHAQSTMPAMGTNTPKGEVAKTDASINPAGADTRSNASSKTDMKSGKHMRKNKTTKVKTTSTM